MSQTYGEMLRERRRVQGITIVELAEKMGVGQAYISELELGVIAPIQEQVEVIQSFLVRESVP